MAPARDKGKGRQSTSSSSSSKAGRAIHGRGANARQARRGAFESELQDIEKRLAELVRQLLID